MHHTFCTSLVVLLSAHTWLVPHPSWPSSFVVQHFRLHFQLFPLLVAFNRFAVCATSDAAAAKANNGAIVVRTGNRTHHTHTHIGYKVLRSLMQWFMPSSDLCHCCANLRWPLMAYRGRCGMCGCLASMHCSTAAGIIYSPLSGGALWHAHYKRITSLTSNPTLPLTLSLSLSLAFCDLCFYFLFHLPAPAHNGFCLHHLHSVIAL